MGNTNESFFASTRHWSLRYRNAYGRVSRDSSVALFDQCIVSGSRFVTTILIGRFCGAQQLGEFALAFQVSMLLGVVMEGLISYPYIIFCNRYEGRERAEYAGSVLLHSAALAILAMAILALAATVMSLGPGTSDFSQITWILVAITPFIVLREFGRRFAFAHLRMGTAVALDLATAIFQIGAIIWLAVTDSLSASTALWAVGLAAAISGAGWLIYDRREFGFRREKILPIWLKNWAAGRWLFGSSIIASATDTSVYWLLAFMSGLTATGILAACMTIVQFANPILLGLGNVLQPTTARAYSEGGRASVRQIVRRGQLSLGIFMTVFFVIVVFVGADVIAFLYQGAEYANRDHTVIVLGLYVLASALELSPSFGLRILEKANLVFFAKLVEAGLILAVIILLAGNYGILAAAYALLLGSGAAALMLSLMFFREVGSTVTPVAETQRRA